MDRKSLTLTDILIICFALLVMLNAARMLAQGVEHSTTRQWHAAMLPKDTGYPPARLDIVETSSACIYIVRNWATGEGNSPGVSVLSKATLLPGKGCQ